MAFIFRLFMVSLFLLVAITPQVLFAQDSDSVTPTPAPSKTPTSEPSTNGNELNFQTPLQPYTQADLAILTGNGQRPNGIVWHDNYLYTVCTGDSTIYQLDDSTAVTRTFIYGVRNAHTMYAENLSNGDRHSLNPCKFCDNQYHKKFGQVYVNHFE